MAARFDTVADLADIMFRNRLTTSKVLERAGIARSTWAAWKRGINPNPSSLTRLRAAIDGMINERTSDGGQGRIEEGSR